jgi:hypothetical protein
MEGSLNIHEADSITHSIGQMLKSLAPTQSPDVYKQSVLQSSDHRYVQNPKVGFRVSNERPAHVPVHSDQNPPKKAILKPSHTTQQNTEKPGLKHLQDMPCTPNKNRCDLKVSSQESEKISAQGHSDDLQPPKKQDHRDSAMSCT